jgi:integrase
MPRRREERARVRGPYFIKASGYYRVTTVEPGADGGRGRQDDRYFRSEQEAQDWKQVVEQRLARLEGRTIGDAITAFEQHLAQNIAEKSATERGWRLRQFFSGAESVQLSRLRPERAADLYDALREGRSVDTHRNFLGNAKGFYAWCVKQGWVASSPLAGVDGVGARRKGKMQLTGDEARKFYAAAIRLADAKDMGALGAAMLLTMGLRSSEVFKRRVRDLDLDGTVLRVEIAKTEKGNRLVMVPEALRPRLLKLAQGRAGFAPLFARGGKAHTKAWLLAAVKRVCKEAGVEEVCPHSLRGVHATIALTIGQSAQVVADALGHESSITTLRHYAQAGSAEAGAQATALRVLEGGRR